MGEESKELKAYINKKRGDLGYGWLVRDIMRPLEEDVKFFKMKIVDKSTPFIDVKLFEISLENAEKQLLKWNKEKEYCDKNKKIAYSLKG